MRLVCCCLLIGLMAWQVGDADAETLRHPETLEQQLLASDLSYLAGQARLRGDARRGALVFYQSAAACVQCHGSGENATPLGPDLARLGDVSDEHIIESLLLPSAKIREGFQTVSLLLEDGSVVTGLIGTENETSVTIRAASDLTNETTIEAEDIVQRKTGTTSMMPNGLVGSLGGLREFYDLARYVMEVAAGGPQRAEALKPTPDQLVVRDDSADLDHAGIIKGLRRRDFDTGKGIYDGYCFNCHGNDGNTPSLPTARAFGTQKMKFGSDPYRMFMTLTRGNGLMAPMSHLTPKERYQVVHYIRQQFMEPTNPDYFEVNDDYLKSLPPGTKDGTEVENVPRDFGPALASQYERKLPSVLTVRLDDMAVSYDLHSMDQAGIWQGGFLDLSETQHARPRGEGTATPDGRQLAGLTGWAWGHDGSLDYPREDLSPRGPMPKAWMDYRGHYLHGDQVVLRYKIDGREVLQLPESGGRPASIRNTLRIGPGKALTLRVVRRDPTAPVDFGTDTDQTIVWMEDRQTGDFTGAGLFGQIDGMRFRLDSDNQLLLSIPSGEQTRQFTIHVEARDKSGPQSQAEFRSRIAPLRASPPQVDFDVLTDGGPERWPEVLKTTGYLGLQRGGYAVDTITIPDSTPWNTWFRTSALDFFSDGRMAVATYGGDVWIVSGIDDKLTDLRWKRFAGGLYEPFGIKVIKDQVYVTCKDRLTRLHDVDGNGEADFYESFSADEDVSVNFHAFNFDLQTDESGNFYYAKSGHGTDSEIPGCVIKVSADGSHREIFCTGFRTPNGMGSLPDGRMTASDNQGQWTPASKINLLRKGGYYGWVGNYSIPGMWAPGGGTIDLDKVVPPASFDPPLVWMPQEFDNSSGGQLFVDDDRWGPLSGRLLHTSFGKGWMSYTMIQEIDDVAQAAIIKLPFDFRTGIMRAAVNPADGWVYATGLQGWNGGGRAGLLENGIERVRYTGKPYKMVQDCKVTPDGLTIAFNFPVEVSSATDKSSYQLQQWNYLWQKSYGSEQYSPSTGEVGIDPVRVESISLGSDGKTVHLNVPDLKPVDQVHVILKLKARDGDAFEEEIYWTINRVPVR